MLRINPPWHHESLADAEAFRQWMRQQRPSLFGLLDTVTMLMVYTLARYAWDEGQRQQANYIEASFAELGPGHEVELFRRGSHDPNMERIARERLRRIIREIGSHKWDWKNTTIDINQPDVDPKEEFKLDLEP